MPRAGPGRQIRSFLPKTLSSCLSAWLQSSGQSSENRIYAKWKILQRNNFWVNRALRSEIMDTCQDHGSAPPLFAHLQPLFVARSLHMTLACTLQKNLRPACTRPALLPARTSALVSSLVSRVSPGLFLRTAARACLSGNRRQCSVAGQALCTGSSRQHDQAPGRQHGERRLPSRAHFPASSPGLVTWPRHDASVELSFVLFGPSGSDRHSAAFFVTAGSSPCAIAPHFGVQGQGRVFPFRFRQRDRLSCLSGAG